MTTIIESTDISSIQKYLKHVKLLSFDIDDTIADSKQPITQKMAHLLAQLLANYKIHLISGGKKSLLIQNTVFPIISESHGIYGNFSNSQNLIFSPTAGAALFSINLNTNKNKNHKQKHEFILADFKNPNCACYKMHYAETFSQDEYNELEKAFNKIKNTLDFIPKKTYGPQLEHRGTMVAFALYGQEAPLEVKKQADPDKAKRKKIVSMLKDFHHKYNIHIAGTSTIDIIKKHIHKGFGLNEVIKFLNIPKENVVFFGDSLFKGGNDYPIAQQGFKCIQVKNWHETYKILKTLLK